MVVVLAVEAEEHGAVLEEDIADRAVDNAIHKREPGQKHEGSALQTG